jgi:hypothetical protein
LDVKEEIGGRMLFKVGVVSILVIIALLAGCGGVDQIRVEQEVAMWVSG